LGCSGIVDLVLRSERQEAGEVAVQKLGIRDGAYEWVHFGAMHTFVAIGEESPVMAVIYLRDVHGTREAGAPPFVFVVALPLSRAVCQEGVRIPVRVAKETVCGAVRLVYAGLDGEINKQPGCMADASVERRFHFELLHDVRRRRVHGADSV